ncbi:DUF1826 domain-containing protein [Neptunomonas marina]|uniref:DUF1826 domain-containing protein n=1 Tax=Neptunomonas marina TaxID=1815562 RepID=A0A437QEE9_9GAMM|nr:DUF1826 domain-containing protein [Neptunomonas marina]RVU32900.1 DUF1826 domain-containing protein [Neptunomonas marina]
MNASLQTSSTQANIPANPIHVARGSTAETLPAIFQASVNLVIFERNLAHSVTRYCESLMAERPSFNLRRAIPLAGVAKTLATALPDLPHRDAFVEDLTLLLEMYACLFDLEEVGTRVQVLDRAMCPRFHTDKLGCRLVSTYVGAGTEWLSDSVIDRSKLGKGNAGLSDTESGLIQRGATVEQVNAGDVVLLKGDGWFDNDGRGAVHRSPAVGVGESRMVVTLDFA